MITSVIRLFATSVLILAAVGCSSLNIQKPTLSFKSADVNEVTADGFLMTYHAAINNPNPTEVPLSNVSYSLLLSDKQVLDGKADVNGSLPANGSKDVTIPVHVKWDDLLKAEQAIVQSKGEVPYNLKGSLALPSNPLLISGVPFSYKNTLSVTKLLREAPSIWSNPAARKLSQELLGSFFK